MITVVYFASLREKLHKSDETLDYEPGLSINDLWDRLNPAVPKPQNLLAAQNHDYVSFETRVSDGDEIAFFPPVTGG